MHCSDPVEPDVSGQPSASLIERYAAAVLASQCFTCAPPLRRNRASEAWTDGPAAQCHSLDRRGRLLVVKEQRTEQNRRYVQPCLAWSARSGSSPGFLRCGSRATRICSVVANGAGRWVWPSRPNGDEKLALFLKVDVDVPLAAGPGFHLALMAPSSEAVDAFHAAAVANGGRDDGGPGLRPHYGKTYYAAFVFDPDGHKLEAKRS